MRPWSVALPLLCVLLLVENFLLDALLPPAQEQCVCIAPKR